MSKIHLGLIALFMLSLAYAGYYFFAFYKNVASASRTSQIFFSSVLDTEKRRRHELHVPILMYHYVEIVTDDRDTIRKSLSITPAIFEDQITTLLSHGFTPITLSNLMDYLNGSRGLPEKPVILTFDDGYRDFYTDVFPILQKRRIRAVLYMVSGFLNTTRNYLTSEQLKAIANSDLVEIAAHSVNHPRLDLLDEKSRIKEITESKIYLQQLVGKPVRHFAYPYGAYNPYVISDVQKAGFETAATVEFGTHFTYAGRYILPRVRVGQATGNQLLDLIK